MSPSRVLIALACVLAFASGGAGEEGDAAIGALVSPHSTLEEMHLAQKLVRGLGSENIDFRLRHSDFSTDGLREGATWLGMSIAEFAALDRVLIVGSFLRKDHPLLAQRLRQAAKKGARIALVHTADDELLLPLAHKAIVAPSALPRALAEILVAAATASGKAVPAALSDIEASPLAKEIAATLASGERKRVFLGSFAEWHPQAAQLHALAKAIAEQTGAALGFLTEAANSVGGTVAGAFPRKSGLHARAMVAEPRKAYLLLHVDPDLLGGMVVWVGDWLYDASVRSRLESIRNQLIERSSHEIQSGRDRFSS